MRLTLRTREGTSTFFVYRIIPNAARTGCAFAYQLGSGVISFAWLDVMAIDEVIE